LPLLAFVHAARQFVDITPGIQQRSKLATVRQRGARNKPLKPLRGECRVFPV
jgi:hypothetical protein